jgi:hypothetical protein
MLDKMIVAGRWILGIQYLLSGLNWYFGFLPMPSIHGQGFPHKHAVVAEMINTGWMFQFAKIVEILVGAALIANRFVPLVLVVAAPVAGLTFLLDAFVLDDIVAFTQGRSSFPSLATRLLDMIVGGACVLLVHIYLMLAYFEYYRPMMVARAQPRHPGADKGGGSGWRFAMVALGTVGLVLGGLNAVWMIGMANEWLIPWSSMRVLRFD